MVTFEVPRSITLPHLLISLFSRFPESFAPLQASHLFKADTVQYSVGLRSSPLGTSISCNFISSCVFALSFEFASRLKMRPQNSPTMHFDNHLDPVSHSKWRIITDNFTVYAFDSISHSILLQKLSLVAAEKTTKWFELPD